jgi:ribosome maturation protein Sdo1
MKKERFDYIIKAKTRQVAVEKRRAEALELTNHIISAYLACLVRPQGSIRIPKSEIRQALCAYSTKVVSDGDCYVISVTFDGDKERCGEQVSEMA